MESWGCQGVRGVIKGASGKRQRRFLSSAQRSQPVNGSLSLKMLKSVTLVFVCVKMRYKWRRGKEVLTIRNTPGSASQLLDLVSTDAPRPIQLKMHVSHLMAPSCKNSVMEVKRSQVDEK